MEIWKPLINFPGYSGSSEGRIMNVRTQRILTPQKDTKGYATVTVVRNNKPYNIRVHRVIAGTFLGYHPGLDVRHKDCNRLNNCVDNLFWSNRKNTIADAYYRGSKKSTRCVPVRVVETGAVYESIRACERAIGCSQSEISRYFAGKLSHVKGYHFERVESHH